MDALLADPHTLRACRMEVTLAVYATVLPCPTAFAQTAKVWVTRADTMKTLLGTSFLASGHSITHKAISAATRETVRGIKALGL